MSIEDIVNSDLKTDLNGKVFDKISQKENKEIPFLSEKTKGYLNEYYESNKRDASGKKTKEINVDLLKKIWINLLIDSICFLKINDTREKYNQTAKGIQDNLDLERKFRDNRKLNSYGIDELAKYFDAFTKFESVLYGSGKYYRDHVEHVIQVWAIGLSLIKNYDFEFPNKVTSKKELYSYKVNKLFSAKEEKEIEIIDDESYKKIDELFISQGEIFAAWTIIALCHDLGYPIEKTYNINEKFKNILKYFGNLRINELNFEFSLFNDYLIEKFLNIVSSKPVITKNEKKHFGYTEIQSKYRDKLSKSLEDYNHGVFSALLIFKSLTYFLETDYSYEKQLVSFEDLRQFYIRREILRAISGHTCPKLYHLNLNNLSFLLILCDELQEWGRPKFEDWKKGLIEDEPSDVRIKTYKKENNVHHVDIKITYDNCDNIEIDKIVLEIEEETPEKTKKMFGGYEKYEKQIIRKFQMFHHLLRSAKDDKDRSFIFNFDIEFKGNFKGVQNLIENLNEKQLSDKKYQENNFSSIIYRFHFNATNPDAFEMLKTYIVNPIPKEVDGTKDETLRYLHIYE